MLDPESGSAKYADSGSGSRVTKTVGFMWIRIHITVKEEQNMLKSFPHFNVLLISSARLKSMIHY